MLMLAARVYQLALTNSAVHRHTALLARCIQLCRAALGCICNVKEMTHLHCMVCEQVEQLLCCIERSADDALHEHVVNQPDEGAKQGHFLWHRA